MKANNLDVLSASQPSAAYPVLPDRDSDGIYHMHQDTNYGYINAAGYRVWRTPAEVGSMIDAAMAQRGFAVLTIHPRDFAVHPDGINPVDTFDQQRANAFLSIINNIRNASGRSIVSFQSVIDTATALNTDLTSPTGSITAPAAGSAVRVGVPFQVTGTAADNVAVSKVEVRAANADSSDGTTYALASTANNWAAWSYTLTDTSASYDMVVTRITDTSGNQSWYRVPVAVTP
jgi:hypothetical protein